MSNEQYENLIALLEKALEFYAEKSNYDKVNFVNGKGNISKIDMDEYGSQARFALLKIKETLDADKKLDDDYNRVIGETMGAIEKNPINLANMIRTIKNIENED